MILLCTSDNILYWPIKIDQPSSIFTGLSDSTFDATLAKGEKGHEFKGEGRWL